MTTLAIVNLAKHFRAGLAGCSATVQALRGVHLTLWPGEIVALAGAPGSGKSTLLRCAAGLLRPDAGQLLWFGGRIVPDDRVAFLSSARVAGDCAASPLRREPDGALCQRVLRADRRRILLIDDLESVSAIERRIVFATLQRCAHRGASVLFAADEELAGRSIATRVVTLEQGSLAQRRKRSAVRIAVSSPVSRARASARSTYGRNLRSPQ